MKTKCAVCDKNIGLFDRHRLKDGVACSNCLSKSGLKREGWQPFYTEVWEVCVLCELNDEQKAKHFENKRKQADREFDNFRNYMDQIKNNAPPTPKCPKCSSTSLFASKKGFGVGKAVIGAAIAGSIGLTLGNAGAKKIRITCLYCGHQWMAGQK